MSDDLLGPGALDPDSPVAPPEATERTSYMIFRLRAVWYAVAAQGVRQAVSLCEAVPVPGTPVFVKGIINVAGQLITLLDLGLLLGVGTFDSSEEEAAPRYLVLQSGGMLVAIRADEVIGLRDVARSSEPSIQTGEDNPAGETFIEGDRVVTVLLVGTLIELAESKVRGTTGWRS